MLCTDGPARLRLEGDKGCGSLKGTRMQGLYVLGDASQDMQLAIVAAAEGVKAGFAANEYLHDREIA